MDKTAQRVKKTLAVLAGACLLFSGLPAAAFAADGGPGGSGGPGGTVTQGTAANEITEDGTYTNTTYTSTSSDENALRVTGATITLDGITVNKSGGNSTDTENGDFYGMNAALLATDSAQVTLKNSTVKSSVRGGNGVFSYGTGTTVNVSDTTITTTSDSSGGIQTTGGATTNATNLTINTSGSSAAPIRSDRGGGTVNVERGSYTSNGYNSPAIYSTADISVADATLTANNSEAFVIEGKNSIALTDCTCSGNMSSSRGTSSGENVHSVMIYQSMSGDSTVGTSDFSMDGCTLTSNNGDVFYITNTSCVVSMKGTKITNKDKSGLLMNVCGNSGSHGWGSAGSNGGIANVTATDQTLEGDIEVDAISKLNLTLAGSSTFTGSLNVVKNAAGGTSVGDNAIVTVEEGATWNLTDDCTITSLDNAGTINLNGHTLSFAGGGSIYAGSAPQKSNVGDGSGGGSGTSKLLAQTITAKAKAKVKKGKKTKVKVKGAKTKLAFKANKKAKKALKIKAKGKKKLVIKAKKAAKRGKTYQVKVFAKASSAYAKSNVRTIKVKVR